MNENKINVYVDCDDTILNSSETVINIINKKYNINKTINDLRDWDYKSIYEQLTIEEVCNIFESDDFFGNVQVKKEFFDLYNNYSDLFNWIFVTKGSPKNLEKKKRKLSVLFPEALFEGIRVLNPENSESKSKINMVGGIQIDDVSYETKETNASVKIIIKNCRDFYWNKVIPNVENTYYVNKWDEIKSILQFFAVHKEEL